jgi:hypothetical protein
MLLQRNQWGVEDWERNGSPGRTDEEVDGSPEMIDQYTCNICFVEIVDPSSSTFSWKRISYSTNVSFFHEQ